MARWLVTGAAGFIGSHLVTRLVDNGHDVLGIDNYSTGSREIVSELQEALTSRHRKQFRFVEGDIRDRATCTSIARNVDFVLHQAALGSVPRSIARPLESFDSNVVGFLEIIDACRLAGCKRFVYASSSSTYGDNQELPKIEDSIGIPLSPYAATKYINEVIANVYSRTYDLSCVGLRYFNVFGPRQNPAGEYAAVVPRWTAALLRDEPVTIFGDGETSRDFCYVENVVQANIKAANAKLNSGHTVFNIAAGEQTTLNRLYELICQELIRHQAITSAPTPVYQDFRNGDIRHSLASLTKAAKLLAYVPTHNIIEGIRLTVPWYISAIGCIKATNRPKNDLGTRN